MSILKIPTSCNCLIIRSINGSPLISKIPFGTSTLIGTILIPNPAARIIAFCGFFSFNSSYAFEVHCIFSSIYPSSVSFFKELFTFPKEYPVISDKIL